MTDVNVLIAFYSRNGSTEALAKAVRRGRTSRRSHRHTPTHPRTRQPRSHGPCPRLD